MSNADHRGPIPGPRQSGPRQVATPDPTPAVVALNLWSTNSIPRSLLRMALDRRTVRALPGCSFAKLLGTGAGRTFTPRDADPRTWAALTCWRDEAGPDRFAASAPYAAWSAISSERAQVLLRPLRSRGTWAGRTPFGAPQQPAALPQPRPAAGMVASLTRARIRPAQWVPFWRAVPPVSFDAHDGGGLLFAIGIGEAPLGLQGTFTLWRDQDALREFTYRRSPHAAAIRRTATAGWYAEELFARFEVLQTSGQHRGISLPPTTTG